MIDLKWAEAAARQEVERLEMAILALIAQGHFIDDIEIVVYTNDWREKPTVQLKRNLYDGFGNHS